MAKINIMKNRFNANRVIICLIAILFVSACSSISNDEETSSDSNSYLPFIGKRSFETRPAISGKATPHIEIEITEEGNVIFYFGQINMADKTETTGIYKAGPFRKVLKCIFKEWDNETRYYEVFSDKIYEVDSAGTRIYSNDCCRLVSNMPECPCESELGESYNY